MSSLTALGRHWTILNLPIPTTQTHLVLEAKIHKERHAT